MKRLAVLLLALLGMLGTATAVPGAARAATASTPSCTVDYLIASETGGIFEAQITVNYTGISTGLGWTLSFKFVAPGQMIIGGWNGFWTQSGSNVAVTSGISGLPGSGSISLGFVGSYVTVNPPPVDFVFNGVPCTEVV